MALELYWGSGSPYAWRVLLALELKGLTYESHLLQFSKQEHKSPQMLAMNPRGRVPVLRDGDVVVYESLACLTYLDRLQPEPPIFGRTPREAATIMRVICEYEAYAERQLTQVVQTVFFGAVDERAEQFARDVAHVEGEARTLEGILERADWLAGDHVSAADLMVFPGIMLLLRAMEKREADDLRARFLPLEGTFPAIARWIARMEKLPGYERTYPPHWRVNYAPGHFAARVHQS